MVSRTRRELSVQEKRLIPISTAAKYLGMGESSAKKLLLEINAQRRFGHNVLYDKVAIDRYLDGIIDGQDAINDWTAYYSGMAEIFECVRELIQNKDKRDQCFQTLELEQIMDLPIQEILKRMTEHKNNADKNAPLLGETVTAINSLTGATFQAVVIGMDLAGRYVVRPTDDGIKGTKKLRVFVKNGRLLSFGG